MSDGTPNEAAPGATIDAGTWLRVTRESAGLSIDTVAQALKLHPRQVKALEDGAFEALPGRTFVRGFIRNYARLLKLDPEAVVAALPGAESAPALEGPSIGSTSRPMGELPVSHASRVPSWSRWAIPLALVVAIAAAALYEFARPGESARPESKGVVKSAPQETAVPPPATGTPLRNPVAGTSGSPAAPDASASRPGETGSPPAAPATAPATPIEAPASAPVAATPAPAPAAAEATLVIHYRSAAWTQVKDASGQTLLITTGQPGTSQTVSGRPPLDVVLGNASDVSVTWRGERFDLLPHTTGNVARARLP